MRRKVFLFLLVFTLSLSAQQKDSIKTYNLEEITVKSGIIIEPKTTTELSARGIEKSNSESIYELTKFIPSVKFQTNSRGESLFYIRGAGKRQTMVFFDGIPLNIPWDNRIDMSMIPSIAIGSMSVIKGIPSITFGANTPSGVVTIFSKEPAEKFEGALDVSGGQDNFKSIKALASGKIEKFSFLGAAGYFGKDDFKLPVEFQPSRENFTDTRINTDYKNLSFFGKARYEIDQSNNINFSASYSDAEKGIAPELNIAEPRFWRYPVWRRTSFSLFGANRLLGLSDNIISYSFSFTNFKQEINEYADNSYSIINDIEKDNNNTLYGRIIYTGFLNRSSLLKFSVNGYAFNHTEKYASGNFAEDKYSQNLLSSGAEYEYLTSNSTFIFGAAYDISSTPETGGKPHSGALGAVSLNSSFLYNFENGYSLRINAGRKTRFASLREAYSGALGRFVLNPELKPEIMNSIESGVIFNNDRVSAEMNIFYNLTEDGIVRQSLAERKFIRLNKERVRTYGAELISSIQLNERLNLKFNITVMDSKSKNSAGSFSDTLEYKPAVISSALIDYRPIGGFNIFSEMKFLSDEFGLKEGSPYFQKLPEYLLLNIRFGYEMNFNGTTAEFYLRINNLFDKLYYPQFGLPEAGREFLGGVNIEL